MNRQLSVKMTRSEYIAGFIFLPFYLFFNGLIIQFALQALGLPSDELTTNLVYFYVNFIFTVIAFRKFLAESLYRFIHRIGRSILGICWSFVVYIGLNVIVNVIIMSTVGVVDNPNNEYISELFGQSGKIITIGAVLLGPLAEEALFRGVIFGFFRKKSRVLAYAMSFICFSAIHVWAYALVSPDWTILVNLIQYLPPTIALCYAYEKGDNIFCPVILHMIVNASAVSAMSAGLF